MLGHVELRINKSPEVLLVEAALSPFSAWSVFALGIALTHVQDLALGIVELHEVCAGPPLKPVKVPLKSIPFPPARQPHHTAWCCQQTC